MCLSVRRCLCDALAAIFLVVRRGTGEAPRQLVLRADVSEMRELHVGLRALHVGVSHIVCFLL